MAGRGERGFMLLEALLAVTIFALGVITLGRCVSNCVAAERLKEEDALARRALENRWAEIEAGSVQSTALSSASSSITDDLKSPFEGMKLRQTTVPVVKKNEKDEKIEGVIAVTLEVTWESDHEEQSKQLMFYVYPRQRQ
jgi:hypothetical protein